LRQVYDLLARWFHLNHGPRLMHRLSDMLFLTLPRELCDEFMYTPRCPCPATVSMPYHESKSDMHCSTSLHPRLARTKRICLAVSVRLAVPELLQQLCNTHMSLYIQHMPSQPAFSYTFIRWGIVISESTEHRCRAVALEHVEWLERKVMSAVRRLAAQHQIMERLELHLGAPQAADMLWRSVW
jgi:hypothetical protein